MTNRTETVLLRLLRVATGFGAASAALLVIVLLAAQSARAGGGGCAPSPKATTT